MLISFVHCMREHIVLFEKNNNNNNKKKFFFCTLYYNNHNDHEINMIKGMYSNIKLHDVQHMRTMRR